MPAMPAGLTEHIAADDFIEPQAARIALELDALIFAHPPALAGIIAQQDIALRKKRSLGYTVITLEPLVALASHVVWSRESLNVG